MASALNGSEVHTFRAQMRVKRCKELETALIHDWFSLGWRGGEAAPADAITERLGRLYGFSFDPTKEAGSDVAIPAAKAAPIDFKAVSESFAVRLSRGR